MIYQKQEFSVQFRSSEIAYPSLYVPHTAPFNDEPKFSVCAAKDSKELPEHILEGSFYDSMVHSAKRPWFAIKSNYRPEIKAADDILDELAVLIKRGEVRNVGKDQVLREAGFDMLIDFKKIPVKIPDIRYNQFAHIVDEDGKVCMFGLTGIRLLRRGQIYGATS